MLTISRGPHHRLDGASGDLNAKFAYVLSIFFGSITSLRLLSEAILANATLMGAGQLNGPGAVCRGSYLPTRLRRVRMKPLLQNFQAEHIAFASKFRATFPKGNFLK